MRQTGICIIVSIVLLLSGNDLAFGQKKSTSKNVTGMASPTLIHTSNESVSLQEFEGAYRRMNDKDPYQTTLDSLKDFLTLYADYKLKLQEAHELGIDKDPKILTEIEGYKKMLAGPFLLDKELTEPAVRKLYERRKYELSVIHFLAAFKNPNDPADTLRAYKKAMKALEKVNNGDALSVVAMGDKYARFKEDPRAVLDQEKVKRPDAPKDTNEWEGSDDKLTAKVGGDIGYFTGGMTVRPFEDAAYSLSVGEMTKTPVRTRFGYHLMQLLDKHPRIGGVKVHHILVAMDRKAVMPADSMKYYRKADSLLQALRNGADFEKVAKESSDDTFTKSKGGDMGYINREDRRTEKSFDQVVYGLKDGEMSGIVRTTFGYHIIRRDGTIPIKSYDEEKDQLKKLYKNYYFNDDKALKMAEYRAQFGAKIDTPTLNVFMSRIDSSRTSLDSNWATKFTPGEKNLPLYEIGGEKVKILTFIDSLNAQPGYPLARNSLLEQLGKTLDDRALALAAKDVEKKYPEFDQIMTDYKNGIILFELENQKVWSKVQPDSTKERAYYQEHKARYMWPERVDVSEIYLLSDSLAKVLYKRILDGENFDSLAKKYTERAGFKEKSGHWGLLQRDENELSKKVFNFPVDDIKQPFEFQTGFSIVHINKRVPITQKTFEEARQEVASQYQDDLSSELRVQWVSELRKKYKREIDSKLIESEWSKNHTTDRTQ
jgi:peptidyl-prolyl cis-trans isomerase SurA